MVKGMKFETHIVKKMLNLKAVFESRKCQLKIQQMAFMLIAVTIFFALAGLFAVGIGLGSIKKSATSLDENDARLLVLHLANTAEFSCGESFEHGEINCIDADKVMILKNHIQDYSGFWDVADIKIRKVYPVVTEKDVFCDQGNYPNCNIIEVYSRPIRPENTKDEKRNFVSLCRKDSIDGASYDKCEIARLIINYEVQRQ